MLQFCEANDPLLMEICALHLQFYKGFHIAISPSSILSGLCWLLCAWYYCITQKQRTCAGNVTPQLLL